MNHYACKTKKTFKLVVKKHRPKAAGGAVGGSFMRGKHTGHKQKCLEHAQPSLARQWLKEVPSLSQHWDQN